MLLKLWGSNCGYLQASACQKPPCNKVPRRHPTPNWGPQHLTIEVNRGDERSKHRICSRILLASYDLNNVFLAGHAKFVVCVFLCFGWIFFFFWGGVVFFLDFRKAGGFIYESWSLRQIKWIIRNIDQSTRSADKLRTHPQTRTKQHFVFFSQVTSPTPERGEKRWFLEAGGTLGLYNWSKNYSYEIQGFSEEEVNMII